MNKVKIETYQNFLDFRFESTLYKKTLTIVKDKIYIILDQFIHKSRLKDFELLPFNKNGFPLKASSIYIKLLLDH